MIEKGHSDRTILSAAPPHDDISFPARFLIVLLITFFATLLLLYSAFAARENRELKADRASTVIPAL